MRGNVLSAWMLLTLTTHTSAGNTMSSLYRLSVWLRWGHYGASVIRLCNDAG